MNQKKFRESLNVIQPKYFVEVYVGTLISNFEIELLAHLIFKMLY